MPDAEWVRIPTKWIRNLDDCGLCKFQPQEAGVSIAALLLYIVIVHQANGRSKKEMHLFGKAQLTYSFFQNASELSRSMISRGLRKLESCGLIRTSKFGKNVVYELIDNNPDRDWAKLPNAYLYKDANNGELKAFRNFTHRNKHELNALKIYLLIVAFRDRKLNAALLTYDTISAYTGIPRNSIRTALSHLTNSELIQIDRDSMPFFRQKRPPSQYRVRGVNPRIHRGTQSSETIENAYSFVTDSPFDRSLHEKINQMRSERRK
jgi:hypothetical protein